MIRFWMTVERVPRVVEEASTGQRNKGTLLA
jgi:hypothetical protein